jgi:ABC-type transport system involved in multi-copper enzyme maturation permease subunit
VSAVMRRSLAAEWTKLRSIPSTTWTVLAVVGITVGLTAFMAAVGSTDANEVGGTGDDDVVVNALFGVWLGQVAIVVLGALAATSEFDTGTIRATLSAIPRRGVVFEAKVAVVAGVALILGLATSVISFLIAQPLLHGGGYNPPAYPHVSITDPFVVRAVFGTALYLSLLALFAMGVGVIVRHTAAAITVAVTLVLAPTVVLGFFTGTIREVLQWLSPVAGMSIQITRDRFDNPPYGSWVGLGLTAAWTIGALLVGAWMFRRRDA